MRTTVLCSSLFCAPLCYRFSYFVNISIAVYINMVCLLFKTVLLIFLLTIHCTELSYSFIAFIIEYYLWSISPNSIPILLHFKHTYYNGFDVDPNRIQYVLFNVFYFSITVNIQKRIYIDVLCALIIYIMVLCDVSHSVSYFFYLVLFLKSIHVALCTCGQFFSLFAFPSPTSLSDIC